MLQSRDRLFLSEVQHNDSQEASNLLIQLFEKISEVEIAFLLVPIIIFLDSKEGIVRDNGRHLARGKENSVLFWSVHSELCVLGQIMD